MVLYPTHLARLLLIAAIVLLALLLQMNVFVMENGGEAISAARDATK